MILAVLQEFYTEPEEEDLKKLQKDADYLIRYHTEQAKAVFPDRMQIWQVSGQSTAMQRQWHSAVMS